MRSKHFGADSNHVPPFSDFLILTDRLLDEERPLRDDEKFARFWAVSFILLILMTYRLWLPGSWTRTSHFPSIPFVDVSRWLSFDISILLVPTFAIASAIIVLLTRIAWCQRAAWLCIVLGLAAGFLIDQHRLQPWAYQTFLYASMFVLLPATHRMLAFRVITISIYFYSSTGKFDYQFVHTVGQEFLATAAGLAHLDIGDWSDLSRVIAASAFPAAELTTAILLTIPRTRRFGGACAIAMHAGLIALLSPWGMRHSSGVIMWNLVLAGQAYWLFMRQPQSRWKQHVEVVHGFRTVGLSVAMLLLVMAVGLPLTERRDRYDSNAWHWDHWMSWALYSPHNSRVDIEVHARAVDALPTPLRSCVADDGNDDSWHKLDLGKLSLESRGVPILPQARYQLSLAIEIARVSGWSREIRGVLRSAADRNDGSRTEIWMNGLQEMQSVQTKKNPHRLNSTAGS